MTGCARTRERAVTTVMIVAGVTRIWVATGMFLRIDTTGSWNRVASLADTGVTGIFVLTLTGCVAEENLSRAGCTLVNGPTDQMDVGPLAAGRISWIIFHMSAMAICALHILTFQVVIALSGMTGGANIDRIYQT